MAVMSTADRNRAARIFARQVYGGNGANCHHGDIVAAVAALDDAMEGTAGSLPGTAGQSLAVRLNATLPEPFTTNATVAHKSALFAVTLGVKYGYLTAGGD